MNEDLDLNGLLFFFFFLNVYPLCASLKCSSSRTAVQDDYKVLYFLFFKIKLMHLIYIHKFIFLGFLYFSSFLMHSFYLFSERETPLMLTIKEVEQEIVPSGRVSSKIKKVLKHWHSICSTETYKNKGDKMY